MIKGFHHVAIRAEDFDATVRFYVEGFGFKKKISWGEGDKRAIMLDTGDGNYVEVFARGITEAKPQGIILHFALRTDDCDADVARAVAAGGVVTQAAKSIVIQSSPHPTPVKLAFIRGLDGEIIEFFQNDLT